MKQLIKISFLCILLFLAIPVFAEEGDMGAGGRAALPTEIAKTPATAIQEENENIFSWVYKQIFDLIG